MCRICNSYRHIIRTIVYNNCSIYWNDTFEMPCYTYRCRLLLGSSLLSAIELPKRQQHRLGGSVFLLAEEIHIWKKTHMEKRQFQPTSTMNPPFFLARRSSKRINMMAWWRVPPAGAGRAAKAVPQAAGSWASPVFLKKSRGKPSNAFTLDFFSVCFFLESRLDCQQQCIWRWAGQDLSSAAQPTVLFWI